MANVKQIEVIKWDQNPLWHIVNNDKCLPMTKWHELPWSHSFKEAEIIANNLMWRKTPFESVPCEVRLVKVYFGTHWITMLVVSAHSKALITHLLKR